MDYPFQCPSCKSRTGLLRSGREPESYKDLIGSACANCGHIISNEDIKRAAIAIVDALAKKLK